VIRAAVIALAAMGAALVGVAPASAAGECKGLKVCIPVAGPWVVIPAPARGSSLALWQLACPQGVVGGIDALASETDVTVDFAGRIGSPVNPGITTAASVVFKGTYAGRPHRVTSFQPFVGCIATSGGGAHTPMAFVRTHPVRPGEPITTRVRTLEVVNGTLARAKLTCKPGERLLGSTHSTGLYTSGAPSAAEMASVRVIVVRHGRQILASATRRGLAVNIHVEVQVLAECAR
jgi:hypothetical protein